jgi:hypothetical protein
LQHVGIYAVLPFSGHSFAGDLPHTTYNGLLLAVSPDIAEMLAVVTPREASVGFVHPHPDCNMAKARQFEYLLGL